MEVLFGLFDAVSASELLFSPIANHLHTSLLKVWTRTLLRLGRPRSCPRPLSETQPGDKRDVLAHHLPDATEVIDFVSTATLPTLLL
jgi:hypothetical protein